MGRGTILISVVEKAIENKGWKVERHEERVGVNYHPHMWAWFGKLDENYYEFLQTYSQNTGETLKSFNRAMQIFRLFDKAAR